MAYLITLESLEFCIQKSAKNPLTCTVRTNICFGGYCVCEHCSVDEVGVTGR